MAAGGPITVTITGFDQSWRFVRTATPVALGGPIGQVTVQFRAATAAHGHDWAG